MLVKDTIQQNMWGKKSKARYITMKFLKYLGKDISNASRELKEIGVKDTLHAVSGMKTVWDFTA